MKYKVVMTDHVYADLKLEEEELARADAEFVFIDTKDEKAIAEAVKDADAVIACYAEIKAEAIKEMKKCRSISKTGIGVNNIDVEQATKQGIQVLNCTDYCTEEVSDTTVALILSLTRRIPFLRENLRNGRWSREGCGNATRISGKTLGFLGFGRIACRTAVKMKPFGADIIAYDPYLSAEEIARRGGRKAELDEVLRKSDILSLNLALTAETKYMMNKETFAKMKKTAVIVNTARGPLINEPDFCEAIRNGQIAGAGLDVICDEKFDPDNPLFSLPEVIVTPHSAYYSAESTQELKEKILADVLKVLKGEEPKYKVNKI